MHSVQMINHIYQENQRLEAKAKAEAEARAKAAMAKPTATAKPKPKAKVKAKAPAMTAKQITAKLDAIDRRIAKLEQPRDWNEALAYIAKRDKCGLVEAGKKAMSEFAPLHPAKQRRAK